MSPRISPPVSFLKPIIGLAAGLLVCGATALASNDRIVTAVFSRVSNGYERPKAADGSPKREYYALANGTFSPGATADGSIDKVKFPQVAGLVAQFLAAHNYYLAPDAKSADFLLLISWGKTLPFSDSAYRANGDAFYGTVNRASTSTKTVRAAEAAAAHGGPSTRGVDGSASKERMLQQADQEALDGEMFQMKMFEDARRDADEYNARLLGYVDEINRRDTPSRFAGAGTSYQDLISDIENERYYIVVSAYDFKTAVNTGKRKLLWATRVSIQAEGNKFNEAAAYMMAKASKYFGQNSGRLVQEYEREGKVTLGELKVIGIEPTPETSTEASDKK